MTESLTLNNATPDQLRAAQLEGKVEQLTNQLIEMDKAIHEIKEGQQMRAWSVDRAIQIVKEKGVTEVLKAADTLLEHALKPVPNKEVA